MVETDHDLLRRFAVDGDDAAFALLFERHGRLVQGVCERVLGDPGGSDDACQATFLMLARHARDLYGKLGRERSLGPWLIRVARNAALQYRRSALARTRREQAFAARRPESPGEARCDLWVEAQPILDEEILQLPDEVRTPIVLCYLEDRTQQDVAEELGVAYGTLRRRLDRGRTLLRDRLVKRGIAVSAVLLGEWLREASASAGTPVLRFDPLREAANPSAALPERAPKLGWGGTVGASLLAVAVLLLLNFLMFTDRPARRGAGARPTAKARPNPSARPADVPPVRPKVAARPMGLEPVERAAAATESASREDGGFFVGEVMVNGRLQRFDDPDAFARALESPSRLEAASSPSGTPLPRQYQAMPEFVPMIPAGSMMVGASAAGAVSSSISVSVQGGNCCKCPAPANPTAPSPGLGTSRQP
ncbi:MAG: sigma-70 family RNA polymerase sigma factor [Isosphaeraceae bacterium]